MPQAPPPDQVPTFKEEWEPYRDQLGALYDRELAIDVRYAKGSMTARDEPHEPHVQVWLRADGELGDDPVLHTCLFTYASDLTLLDTTTLPHCRGALDPSVQMASLDHAMWFHRPFRMDDWLLYDQRSPSASGARGLATGSVFTREGDLVVSVVQEGLIRPIDGR
jgi:acyl-CoA thioesterase-2